MATVSGLDLGGLPSEAGAATLRGSCETDSRTAFASCQLLAATIAAAARITPHNAASCVFRIEYSSVAIGGEEKRGTGTSPCCNLVEDSGVPLGASPPFFF